MLLFVIFIILAIMNIPERSDFFLRILPIPVLLIGFTLVFPLSICVAPFSDMCYTYYIYLFNHLLNIFSLPCPLPSPPQCGHPPPYVTLCHSTPSHSSTRIPSFLCSHSALGLLSKWMPSSVHLDSQCWAIITSTAFSLSSASHTGPFPLWTMFSCSGSDI